MLQLPKFGHMTTSAIKFESRDKILLVTLWTETDIINFISKNIYFTMPRVANFADTIKIATMFIKTTYRLKKI